MFILMTSKAALTQISVLAELDRAGVHYEWAGQDEIKIRCPFHEDERPSCDVSVSKRMFKCHAAGCVIGSRGGDFITLLAGIVNRPRGAVLEELGTRYDLKDVKIVEPEVVERWHGQIWAAGPLLAELRKRCVTDEMIVARKLGEDNGRITIPIANERGDWVNVRRYLPGAPGNEKMRNQRGRGSTRLYPVDQMSYDAVMLCGGEMKALVAAGQLNAHGVGAVCATQAEDLLPPELLKKFAGKVVYVCEDVDAHGRAASRKNCAALKPIASEIYDVLLPLNLDAYPKGDVNDFVAEGGDLWGLLRTLEPWTPLFAAGLDNEDPTKLHMSEAINAHYAKQRVLVTGVVTVLDTAPYVVPKVLQVKCDKSQNVCAICPVWMSPDQKFTIHPEHGAILSMVSTTKRSLPEAMMEAVGIPRGCRVCEFDVHAYYNAEDARLSPQLEITERATESRIQPAICIGEGLELNESYEFTGRMYPHPMTQQSTLLISQYDPTRDALSTYVPENLERLLVFRPAEWSVAAINEKLKNIYDDLVAHVTHIRQRHDMHTVIDLVYHSPLLITMGGRTVKGWTEGLIVGDSAQGKTEATVRMMNHYGLGGRLECKNASTAGLLGGCQQISNGRWIVTWGFIPSHDKGLAILEELKGASTEVIGKLTDMRSSGVAEITKIEKRRTHARCRILAVSNPRYERKVASYSFGIEAAKELIGALEDLRRFDIVHIISSDEIDTSTLNAAELNGHPATYSAADCRALLLWAWTRTPEQCVLSSETVEVCLRCATQLCDEFSDAVPIIDRGSMRYKLARLAASVACRTFSASDDMQSIEVRPCHVVWVAEFLRRTYSTRAMGYKEYTETVKTINELKDADQIKKNFMAMPFPHEAIQSFIRADRIDVQDIQDWTSWDRPEAMHLLSLLVRKHAVKRDYKGYRKTSAFISLLRSMADSKGIPERPDFIQESEF